MQEVGSMPGLGIWRGRLTTLVFCSLENSMDMAEFSLPFFKIGVPVSLYSVFCYSVPLVLGRVSFTLLHTAVHFPNTIYSETNLSPLATFLTLSSVTDYM